MSIVIRLPGYSAPEAGVMVLTLASPGFGIRGFPKFTNLMMRSFYNPRIMRLLVFVGAGSPELPQYQDVYELLQKAAPQYGYTETDWSIRWNGQGQQPHLCDEPIRLTTAVGDGSRKIAKYEESGLEYDLLGRSFGGLVAASCGLPNGRKDCGG
jgi:hypothetical protein